MSQVLVVGNGANSLDRCLQFELDFPLLSGGFLPMLQHALGLLAQFIHRRQIGGFRVAEHFQLLC